MRQRMFTPKAKRRRAEKKKWEKEGWMEGFSPFGMPVRSLAFIWGSKRDGEAGEAPSSRRILSRSSWSHSQPWRSPGAKRGGGVKEDVPQCARELSQPKLSMLGDSLGLPCSNTLADYGALGSWIMSEYQVESGQIRRAVRTPPLAKTMSHCFTPLHQLHNARREKKKGLRFS